jgi:hypothetical protein
MIISPVFVGGADANQKGFGELMPPAKFRTLMSGMGYLRRFQHGERGALAPSHRIHNLAPAVHAVAAGIVDRIPRLPRNPIRHNLPITHL